MLRPSFRACWFGHDSTDFQWDLDYDPVLHQVNASTIFVGQRLCPNGTCSGGQSYLHVPGEVIPATVNQVLAPDIFNQFRRAGHLRQSQHVEASALPPAWLFDIKNDYVQGATVQSTYNWDCCGVTFEYRRWALGTVRNENDYRFAFSLTNVGTFGNLEEAAENLLVATFPLCSLSTMGRCFSA